MKKEIADKWIAALRSGEYTQTKGHLCLAEEYTAGPPSNRRTYPPGYCCLGVLCEVAIKEGVDIVKSIHSNPDEKAHIYNNNGSFLPEKVVNWAGMKNSSGDPQLDEDGAAVPELVALNDDEGCNFNEIADHIAKYWEHL